MVASAWEQKGLQLGEFLEIDCMKVQQVMVQSFMQLFNFNLLEYN